MGLVVAQRVAAGVSSTAATVESNHLATQVVEVVALPWLSFLQGPDSPTVSLR